MEPLRYLRSNFLDILFEGKNKSYGAYELRLHYEQRLGRAMAGTLLCCLLLTGLFLARHLLIHTGSSLPIPVPADLSLSKVKLPETIVPPPPPRLPAEVPPLKKQIKYTSFNVVEDDKVPPDAVPPDIDQLKTSSIGIENRAGDDKGIDVDLLPDKNTGIYAGSPSSEKEKIFNYVEQMPRFAGSTNNEESDRKIMQFLAHNIRYPEAAREDGIQGIVSIQFVVAADGSIEDVHAVGETVGHGLEEEAIRVLKAMPRWIPGKQNGRPVNVRFSIPVRFLLQ